MTLQEKLRDIKRTSTLTKLNEYPATETAKDLNELWEKVIEPNLPDKNAVAQWHEILLDYIEQDNISFSIRRFGSRSKKENSMVLRRGFLNKVFWNGQEQFNTFYVDNSFPAYFYSMVKDGYAPKDCKELKTLIDNFEFPCGFIQTDAEKKLAAYKRGVNPEISTKGYKIAHIFSAGEKYDTCAGYSKIADFCKTYFPRGEREEWQDNTLPSGKYYRPIELDESSDIGKIKKFAIAHFLRTVHPINYFLVPNKINTRDKSSGIIKTNIYWYDYDNGGQENNEIGEYPKLVEYVAAKVKDIYKDVFGVSGKSIYQEFLDLIYPTGNCVDPKETNVTIDAEYAIGIWQKKVGTVPASTSKAKTKTSGSRVRSNYAIELIPNDKDLFKNELLIKKQAKRTITYKDGSVKSEVWDASGFSPSSNLGGNVSSQIWHRNDKDQIDKVVFEV